MPIHVHVESYFSRSFDTLQLVSDILSTTVGI